MPTSIYSYCDVIKDIFELPFHAPYCLMLYSNYYIINCQFLIDRWATIKRAMRNIMVYSYFVHGFFLQF